LKTSKLRKEPNVNRRADTKETMKKNTETHQCQEDNDKDFDEINKMLKWRKKEKR
jgi:hypothetical protein